MLWSTDLVKIVKIDVITDFPIAHCMHSAHAQNVAWGASSMESTLDLSSQERLSAHSQLSFSAKLGCDRATSHRHDVDGCHDQ